ncbi:MAG: PrgI family protein [Oscillospiraceae bacterium]|nr:PrgI family protein [Oscillospiraceae bacterium]
MAYVPVPKDLAKVKSKVAFNLTKRQIICFVLAAVVAVPVYFLTRKLLGQTLAAMLMVTLALPFFLLAMYERDGMPFEQIVKNIIRVKLLYPAERPYRTTNLYEMLDATH